MPLNTEKVEEHVEQVFKFHIKMLEFIEEVPAAVKQKSPASKVTKRWCSRKVANLHTKWGTEPILPSKQTIRIAECELYNCIQHKRPFEANQRLSDKLTKESLEKLSTKAANTISKIESNNFAPSTFTQSRFWNRLYSILPMTSFTTSHIMIDTVGLQQVSRSPKLEDVGAGASNLWEQFFDVSLLQGVSGVMKRFDHYITTDGVKASFKCVRPKRSITEDTITTTAITSRPIWGLDPGIRSIATLANNCSISESTCPPYSIKLSANQYHHLSFHHQSTNNLLQRMRHQPTVIEHQKKIGIHKTSKNESYIQYLQSIYEDGRWLQLLDFHQENREDNWRCFRYRQRTLAQFTNHIFDCSQGASNKKDVVIAYGDARLNHAMRSHKPVPVKRLPKVLSTQMTVKYVNEFRTSQICSQLCDDEYIPMDNAIDNESGDMIYAVKYCENCKIYWDRDANAARNILYRFLCEECFNDVDARFSRK